MELTDKVALITGGRRIGARSSPPSFARKGAHVAVVSPRLARRSRGNGRRASRADARAFVVRPICSSPRRAGALSKRPVAEFGRLDVLVNMASIYRAKAIDDPRRSRTGTRRWRSTCAPPGSARMRPFRICAARAEAAIVNFSDWVARSGRPRYPGYSAVLRRARPGVIALTEALALGTRRGSNPRQCRGARARSSRRLAPPTADSAAVEQRDAGRPLGRRNRDREGRHGARRSDFITGETIRVDGGRHLK